MIEIIVRSVEKIEKMDWKKGLGLKNLTVEITIIVESAVI